MASIQIVVLNQLVKQFKEVIDSTDLVDVLAEKEGTHTMRGSTIFTLDAGMGNSINYYYLGLAWGGVCELSAVAEQLDKKAPG
jgi:hypothetical protein